MRKDEITMISLDQVDKFADELSPEEIGNLLGGREALSCLENTCSINIGNCIENTCSGFGGNCNENSCGLYVGNCNENSH